MLNKEKMNEAYREACKKDMRKEMLAEYDRVMNNEDIPANEKDFAFNIIMNILTHLQ
jgi:hypothetical protein